MRVFLPMALLLGLSGVAWGLPFVLRGEGVQTGAMLGIVSGLLLFMLGLLAEQLAFVRKSQLED